MCFFYNDGKAAISLLLWRVYFDVSSTWNCEHIVGPDKFGRVCFALSWQHGDLEPLVMLIELQYVSESSR